MKFKGKMNIKKILLYFGPILILMGIIFTVLFWPIYPYRQLGFYTGPSEMPSRLDENGQYKAIGKIEKIETKDEDTYTIIKFENGETIVIKNIRTFSVDDEVVVDFRVLDGEGNVNFSEFRDDYIYDWSQMEYWYESGSLGIHFFHADDKAYNLDIIVSKLPDQHAYIGLGLVGIGIFLIIGGLLIKKD